MSNILVPGPIAMRPDVERRESYFVSANERKRSFTTETMAARVVIKPSRVTRYETATPRSTRKQEPALLALFRRLQDAMIEQAADSEEELPTEHALGRAWRLLSSAASLMPAGFPNGGDLYSDGEGGLRSEWANNGRQVRLVIHKNNTEADYIYHQVGNICNLETDITPRKLAGWLRWMTDNVK